MLPLSFGVKEAELFKFFLHQPEGLTVNRVTAAGICPDEPFLDRKPDSVARCMSINVLGTYYAAQLATAQMQRQEPLKDPAKRGSMVFIASIAAYVASKGQTTSDYCASKGAVVALTKALGVELAACGVRVNSISPGFVALRPPLCLGNTDEFDAQVYDDRHDP